MAALSLGHLHACRQRCHIQVQVEPLSSQMIDGFVSNVRKWLELRALVRELEQLDDHALRDLGISRHQIRSAVLRGRQG
jgi:uncharacterized protein YjiS (DUF1127 family)